MNTLNGFEISVHALDRFIERVLPGASHDTAFRLLREGLESLGAAKDIEVQRRPDGAVYVEIVIDGLECQAYIKGRPVTGATVTTVICNQSPPPRLEGAAALKYYKDEYKRLKRRIDFLEQARLENTITELNQEIARLKEAPAPTPMFDKVARKAIKENAKLREELNVARNQVNQLRLVAQRNKEALKYAMGRIKESKSVIRELEERLRAHPATRAGRVLEFIDLFWACYNPDHFKEKAAWEAKQEKELYYGNG